MRTMFTEKDMTAIRERGSDPEAVMTQLENFRSGFPFLHLIKPATPGDGITKLSETEIPELTGHFDESVEHGISLMKFVPASGAASRMFKTLFEAKQSLNAGAPESETLADKELKAFVGGLRNFGFYNELKKISGKPPEQLGLAEILNLLLTGAGLNYGNLPKGLLLFHRYGDSARTPFEEHCIEGAFYAKNSDRTVKIHFTVSPEHQPNFEEHLAGIRQKMEQTTDSVLDISFSQQKPSTDTVAVTPENEPFRDNDGSLLFRPGGHGALLANLNELDADLIFIKNIDNIAPDYLKPATVTYKKALAGLLLKVQHRIFEYQKIFDTHHYSSLDSMFLAEAANFLENILFVIPPENQYYTEKEDLFFYLKSKFNRPIRVCGMVRNQGEPGGGPFWAINNDASVSLQIVESSQIDLTDPDQKEIFSRSTHFNPVDLVCAFKNYKGEKYNLFDFRDPKTGFIAHKSKDGKELKAQELPGLWNGAMADWNTLFVEVPVATFSPVKTVNDLLRKEHQPE
ncbi:MAG: DUF4301 family protein [Prolixibacteraceae bacterium]